MKIENICLAIRDGKTVLISVHPDRESKLEELGYEVLRLGTTTFDNFIPSGILIGRFADVNPTVLENLRFRCQAKQDGS